MTGKTAEEDFKYDSLKVMKRNFTDVELAI
jgi:hypothetical protein